MAGEAAQAFKDIALEQKDDQGSLKLQENFDKKFETRENRDKLYKAAKEGLNNLDPKEKDEIKNGIEKSVKSSDFQSKFDEVIKIDKSTWLNKGALSPQQRGMVSLLYLFGGLNGEKNASPEDVVNIYNKLKTNPTMNPLEPVAFHLDTPPNKTEVTAETILKNTKTAEPQNINKPIASRENLAENKPLGDVIGTIPSIDENMEVQKIMKKIKRLENRLDDDNNTEEINEKQSDIGKIENKITDLDEKIQEKTTYMEKIPENLKSLLLTKNQTEIKALTDEKQILNTQKNILQSDITELQNEDLKDNNKDEKQFAKISEQVTKLQEQLSGTKENYVGQKELLTNQISAVKGMMIEETSLEGLEQTDKDIVIQQNNKLKPQLADLEKKLDTVDANITKIDNIIGEKGQINSYLAQYKPEQVDDKTTQQATSTENVVADKTEQKAASTEANKLTAAEATNKDETPIPETQISKENLTQISEFLKDFDITIKRGDVNETNDYGEATGNKIVQTYLSLPGAKDNFSINDTDSLQNITSEGNKMTLNFNESDGKAFNITFEKNGEKITTSFVDEQKGEHKFLTDNKTTTKIEVADNKIA